MRRSVDQQELQKLYYPVGSIEMKDVATRQSCLCGNKVSISRCFVCLLDTHNRSMGKPFEYINVGSTRRRSLFNFEFINEPVVEAGRNLHGNCVSTHVQDYIVFTSCPHDTHAREVNQKKWIEAAGLAAAAPEVPPLWYGHHSSFDK